MEIRELAKTDLQPLLELSTHLHRADSPLPAPQTVQKVWNQIQSNNCFKYFGLFENNQMVSSCTLTIVPNLTRNCRPYGLIENVVTHAEHRGHGYAKALLKHSLEYAWGQGCYKVMLLTGRKDKAVLRFYESAGFDRHAKQAFYAKAPK